MVYHLHSDELLDISQLGFEAGEELHLEELEEKVKAEKESVWIAMLLRTRKLAEPTQEL